MEDISRELEREIALSKPKPYRQDLKTKLLIVDDFGVMKSGDYYKTLVKFLSIFSVICFVAAIVFLYLYSGLSKDSSSIKAELDIAREKVNKLSNDKEILMAKLVISGKKFDIIPKPVSAKKQVIKPLLSENRNKKKKMIPVKVKKKEMPAKIEKKKKETSAKVDKKEKDIPVKIEKKEIVAKVKKKEEIEPESDKNDGKSKLEETIKIVESIPLVTLKKDVNKTVVIENFVVKKAKSNKDLLVRFDIKKISKAPGDVSGRIFTVLRPESKSQDQWLVVPTTPLKDGIPTEYKKGQYFSIAHFKPVKFRIKNQANPDFYKKASIFIFNEQKELIFEKLINITETQ